MEDGRTWYGIERFLISQKNRVNFSTLAMDELDLPDKNSGMLSFRAPRKDRVDVFVTKSDLKAKTSIFNDLPGIWTTTGAFSRRVPQGS